MPHADVIDVAPSPRSRTRFQQRPEDDEGSEIRAVRLALSRFTGVATIGDLATITADIARSVTGAFRVEFHVCKEDAATSLIAESMRGTCGPVPGTSAVDPLWPEELLTCVRYQRVVALCGLKGLDPTGETVLARFETMGTEGVVLAALTHQDRLIGVLVCLFETGRPHAQPLLNMLETLAGMSSLQLVALQHRDILEQDRAARAVLASLLSGLQAGRVGSEAIHRHGRDLLNMLDSVGCALVEWDDVTGLGACPDAIELRNLVQDWEEALAKGPVMETLPSDHAHGPGLDVIAVPVVPSVSTLLWFRGVDRRRAIGAGARGWREVDVECACRVAELWERLGTREHLVRARHMLQKETTLLVQTSRELERFAYLASHDLREPLRMVVSYCRLLQQRYGAQLDQQARDFLGFAVDGARRMDHLVEGLGAYLQVTSHGAPFELTPLGPLVDQALEGLKARIDESGAAVTVDTLPILQADRAQIILMFTHLINNALTFVPSGMTPRLHIASRVRRDHVDILIEDQGIGLRAEFAERIFDLFQRLHTRDEYPGDGLGLAICRRIVTRHGGIIRAVPKRVGTRFIVTLPIRTGFDLEERQADVPLAW